MGWSHPVANGILNLKTYLWGQLLRLNIDLLHHISGFPMQMVSEGAVV